MLPFLDFDLFGYPFHLHTNTSLMILFAIVTFVLFTMSFKKESLRGRAALLCLIGGLGAFFGARLFHLLFEQPLNQFRWSQFLRFDGMTFYGSLLFGGAVAVLATTWLFPRRLWGKIADQTALICAFGYGVLRIGCFANGCCWGRITNVPWAVTYMNNPVMPAWGIPVHPVQLYDSFLGFALGFFLIWLRRRQPAFRALLFPVFVIGYSIGRMITETFRGDVYRGEHVFMWFSTSQTISIGLFLLAGVFMLASSRRIWIANEI